MKTVLWHLFGWTVWFYATSFYSLAHLPAQYVIPTCFNYCNVLLVFYTCYFLSIKYLGKNDFEELIGHSFLKKCLYFIFRWEVLVLLILLMGNIVFCWMIDNYLVSIKKHPGVYPNFWFYAEGKFARELFFASIAFTIADKRQAIIRKDAKILYQQEHMKIVVREKNNVVNFYNKEIRVMKAMMKRLNDHDSENGTDG